MARGSDNGTRREGEMASLPSHQGANNPPADRAQWAQAVPNRARQQLAVPGTAGRRCGNCGLQGISAPATEPDNGSGAGGGGACRGAQRSPVGISSASARHQLGISHERRIPRRRRDLVRPAAIPGAALPPQPTAPQGRWAGGSPVATRRDGRAAARTGGA